MTLALIIVAVVWLAYSNGANDNFKGVATLFGSGTTTYRSAIGLATVATAAGSLASIAIGSALVAKFSGKDLVPDGALTQPEFAVAVAMAAAGTVFLATRLGLPISTTHALVGSLVGAGLASGGLSHVNLASLGTSFVTPLLVAPFAAMALALVAYPIAHGARKRLGISRDTCICIGDDVLVVAPSQSHAAQAIAVGEAAPYVAIADASACFERYGGRVAGLSLHGILDRLHYLSAGAVCFARGLNDTPKVVALFVVAQALEIRFAAVIVGIAMAVGGLLSARRVAETMSHRITGMNHGQGFIANVSTAVLVIWASRWGLPVSTTHVSCGALFGIGAATGTAHWRQVALILTAWITTLPIATTLAAVVFFAVA